MEYAHNGRNTFDGRARNCTLSNLLLKNEIDMICELYTRLLIRWQKRVRLNADLPCSLSRLCEVGQTRLISLFTWYNLHMARAASVVLYHALAQLRKRMVASVSTLAHALLRNLATHFFFADVPALLYRSRNDANDGSRP